jgi:predicted RNase H-like HicB family nuclease
MEKNLEYYMGLPYVIEIVPLSKEDGGGILARIPLFGVQGIVGDGATVEEALTNLDITREIILSKLISENIEIPEPQTEKTDDSYSGKILTRMPKWLHHKLAINADRNDSSLNLYIVTLLASAVEQDISLSRYEEINSHVTSMCDCVKEIKDNIISKFAMNLTPSFSYSDEYSEAKAA